MVSSRKRGRQEMEAVEPQEMGLLHRIRNMWEFANLIQWIFIFGRAVKIDEDLDIEDFELEFLQPNSTVLQDIGLALLKFVSSHRGLTPEIFDEYTRRQYIAKAPNRNPFGVEEEPARFSSFDVFTKIQVLQQLTQWTMGNPDRIRERMEEQKDSEQTIWRIEPFGWDSEDRTYIVLDDNRLYRRTDPLPPPSPPPKLKKNSKKARAARRSSKRRKTTEIVESDVELSEGAKLQNQAIDKGYDGLGGMKWECMAVTLEDYNNFVSAIEKSRDPNEKILRKRVVDDVLPLLEKQEEARKRKQAQKERELLNMEKLAHAKRSSRIAGKIEQQKQEEEAREAERRKVTDLATAKKEQEKWLKLEKERESRMVTREQRLKEREARRILHEEELANLSEDSRKIQAGEGRLSERHLKVEIERKKQALEELAEQDDWIFDCICGAYGQIDDGTHSIACDKCNIWQHSKCVGVGQSDAERDDFSFVCKTCQRRAEDAERARTQLPIKIKLNRPSSSSSSGLSKDNGSLAATLEIANTNLSPQTVDSQAFRLPRSQNTKGQQSKSCKSVRSSPFQETREPHSRNLLVSKSNRQTLVPLQFNQVENPVQTPIHSSADLNRQESSPGPISSLASAPEQQALHANSSLRHQHNRANLTSPGKPPGKPQTCNFLNGSAPRLYDSSTPDHTPIQNTGVPIQIQSSPSVTPSQINKASLIHIAPSEPMPGSSRSYRSSPAQFPSPFTAAPTLTPTQNSASISKFTFANTPLTGNQSGLQYNGSSPVQSTSPPSMQYHISDPGHSSALPPAGISPTKNSPPRPIISNGSFGSQTPTILPPVASLTPSPQMQNLAPPVKSSEPERSRSAS